MLSSQIDTKNTMFELKHLQEAQCIVDGRQKLQMRGMVRSASQRDQDEKGGLRKRPSPSWTRRGSEDNETTVPKLSALTNNDINYCHTTTNIISDIRFV